MKDKKLADIFVTIGALFIYIFIMVVSFLVEKYSEFGFKSRYFSLVAFVFLAIIPLIFLKKFLSKNFPLRISETTWSSKGLVLGGVFGLSIVIIAAIPQLISSKIQCCSYYSGVAGYVLTLAEIFIAAFQEEVLHRVILLALFVVIFRSFSIAIVLQAIAFGIGHSEFHWSSLDSVLFFILPALILGLVFCLKNDLSLITGIHFGLNFGNNIFFSVDSLLNFDKYLEQNKTSMNFVLGASLIGVGAYFFWKNGQHQLNNAARVAPNSEA